MAASQDLQRKRIVQAKTYLTPANRQKNDKFSRIFLIRHPWHSPWGASLIWVLHDGSANATLPAKMLNATHQETQCLANETYLLSYLFIDWLVLFISCISFVALL